MNQGYVTVESVLIMLSSMHPVIVCTLSGIKRLNHIQQTMPVLSLRCSFPSKQAYPFLLYILVQPCVLLSFPLVNALQDLIERGIIRTGVTADKLVQGHIRSNDCRLNRFSA